MKKVSVAILAFVVFSSHDMYLKLDRYFLEPHSAASIMLLNGTFEASENTIDRNRMLDVSLVGHGKRSPVDSTQWREDGMMTVLDFTTGDAGTWVAGVSTGPRNIEMAAADFNAYLEHDGVLDELEWRRTNDQLAADAVEKYSKHVKTIFQVGGTTTDDWKTPLDYPIEFIPLSNPYDLHIGDELEVKLLFRGEALRDQIVIVGSSGQLHTHDHEHAEEAAHHHHHEDAQLRTDQDGKLRIKLAEEGIWYLRTIFMIQAFEDGLTHESNWATLTFAVGHGPHGHTHGLNPNYLYGFLGLLLVAVLFFWFRGRQRPTGSA
jgi:ABC-type nickel/cobalt efflux system permease component RcnA